MEISGYKLLAPLGSGGMSEVFRAEQLSLKRTVAIKFLSEALLDHDTAKELFENEPLIVARLNHPKIIHVIDKGITDNGKPYFVMEYVAGVTLHDLVQDEKVPTSRKVDFLIQICRGLSFAHRNGIIHRDIKPANIIIDNEHNARILDFGIASFYMDERFSSNPNTVLGTERYMAPELKQSAGASLLSDLYSLGVLMFEVFAENFVDLATDKTIAKADIPNPIKKIILECIDEDPNKRPTSAAVIENKLLHIIKGAHLALSQKQNADKDIASLSKTFTLLDVLNENDFGSVYLYEKNNTNDLIVIKKRNNDTSGLKEAKLLANLKHSNIVNIHGTASNNRTFIIVMEYMEGGALAERLVQPYEFTEFFRIAQQLLSALSFAHKNRICHGNIRPSNILFDKDDIPKLADFGMSEHYHHNEDINNWYHPQILEPVSITLDIFALGAVFYHMLTGEPINWENGQITWTESYDKLPKRIREWLLKMMALDANYRYRSVNEVEHALNTLMQTPKSELKRKEPLTPISLRRNIKQSLTAIMVIKRFFWITTLALVFFYIQIYVFLPDIKTFIHQLLKEFLLWWASKL
ncbi:MAG: serine/threonine-protein kinase [Kangiellaceae bacterium]|jgi:serine/threonine-protein kinase|nr:serine/threonine-protein kinase [Kangiellaceae bacterium]